MVNKLRSAFLSRTFVLLAPLCVLFVAKTDPHQTSSAPPTRKNTTLVVPLCSNADPVGQRMGSGIKFKIPKALKVETIADIDYREYLVHVSKDVTPLELWWGVLVSAPLTTQKLIKTSISSQERSIQDFTKTERGFDSQGHDSEAKFWRVFDVPGVALAKYEGVPEQTRRSYDTIIDSACFDQP